MNKIIKNEYYGIYILKVLSALFVFTGHYFLILRDGNYKNIYVFYKYFPVILDESFWMIIFCILSGFLLYRYADVIIDVYKLKNIIIKRFLRFIFPIFWFYVLIYIILLLIPNYGVLLGRLIDNERLANHIGSLTILDVFREPIITLVSTSYKFSGPFWMLGSLFRANLSVLIYIFITNCINNNRLSKVFLYVFCIILFIYNYIFNNHTIGVSVVLGYFLAKYIDLFKKYLFNINKLYFCIAILVILFGNFIDKLLIDKWFFNFIFYHYIKLNYLYCMFYAIAFVLLIILYFENKLINKYVKLLSDISFDFFGLHMCIICTFSSFIVYKMLVLNYNFLIAFFISYFLTVFVTLFTSLLSNKMYNKLLKSILSLKMFN